MALWRGYIFQEVYLLLAEQDGTHPMPEGIYLEDNHSNANKALPLVTLDYKGNG